MIRLPIQAGTNGPDTLAGTPSTITFGLRGNDTLQGPTQSNSLTMLFGGSGDDSYTVSGFSTVVIDDSDGTDSLIADGINLASDTTYAAAIDQRHLLLGDGETGQTLYLLDWLAPTRELETVTLGGTTMDYETFKNAIWQDDQFIGNVTWEDLGRSGQTPPSTVEMNEAIDYYRVVSDSMAASDHSNTLPIAAARGEYTITPFEQDPSVLVVAGQGESYGTLGVDRFAFNDGTLAFDVEGTCGQAYRLYEAAFNRDPDAGGLGFWTKQLEQGQTLQGVANGFLVSEEFQARYGASPTPEAYVQALYNNVLERDPDAEGYAYWQGTMANGMTEAEVLTHFSESAENKQATAAATADGMWFV